MWGRERIDGGVGWRNGWVGWECGTRGRGRSQEPKEKEKGECNSKGRVSKGASLSYPFWNGGFEHEFASRA